MGQNKILEKEQNSSFSWGPFKEVKHCARESIPTPWSIEKTFDLATAAIDQLKLGQGKDTDLLLLSLSAHDYLGHRFGPNSPHLKAMTLEEDRLLGKFLDQLAKKLPGGLNDVFFVMTGDHGMLPTALPEDRVETENVGVDVIPNIVEKSLTDAYGSPKGGKWVQSMQELQVYFNEEALKEKKVTSEQAVKTARASLVKERFVDDVWSKTDIMVHRKVPAGEMGVIADRTVTERSGDLITILKPYFYSDEYKFTHMTHYSYDRYVPLVFYGRTFKPGIYRQVVRVIDLAPTISSILHVLPPNQSEGRILTEILR
jgi:hypothetical protein